MTNSTLYATLCVVLALSVVNVVALEYRRVRAQADEVQARACLLCSETQPAGDCSKVCQRERDGPTDCSDCASHNRAPDGGRTE